MKIKTFQNEKKSEKIVHFCRLQYEEDISLLGDKIHQLGLVCSSINGKVK